MKLLFENFRKFVHKGGFSGNGPLAEPIEEIGGLRFDDRAPFVGAARTSAEMYRREREADKEEEQSSKDRKLRDLLWDEVETRLGDEETPDKILEAILSRRENPTHVDDYELQNFDEKVIWNQVTNIVNKLKQGQEKLI